MEKKISQKVDLIADCIFEKVQKTQESAYGIYSGEFGLLLFLLYYSRFSGSDKHTLLGEKYAEQLLQQFVVREKIHTFCSGLSGILYLIDFLREKEIIDMDVSEIRPFLDNYVVSRMRQDMRRHNFDFMHGALGVGLYFLKRKTYPEYIHEIVDFLYHTAEKDSKNQSFKWKSVINYEDNLCGYNLALSHGISSIIIFLSRVVNGGICNEKISKLLTGSVNFVLDNQNDVSQFGSYFPNYLLINSLNPDIKSRMAWCYGDLGIGLALLKAGKAVDYIEWSKKGIEILLQCTQRRAFTETFASDAGICHGSSMQSTFM